MAALLVCNETALLTLVTVKTQMLVAVLLQLYGARYGHSPQWFTLFAVGLVSLPLLKQIILREFTSEFSKAHFFEFYQDIDHLKSGDVFCLRPFKKASQGINRHPKNMCKTTAFFYYRCRGLAIYTRK